MKCQATTEMCGVEDLVLMVRNSTHQWDGHVKRANVRGV